MPTPPPPIPGNGPTIAGSPWLIEDDPPPPDPPVDPGPPPEQPAP